MHVMLDLETYGTRPGYAIASIGAVPFSLERGVNETFSFYAVAKIETITDPIDPSTMAWWFRQSEDARKELISPQAIDYHEMLAYFGRWWIQVAGESGHMLWANGPAFDVTLLEAAFDKAKYKLPWDHRTPRDYRTALMLAGTTAVPRRPELIQHHALHDAIHQAESVLHAWRTINKWKLDSTYLNTLRQ